jgi:hypothetical protein
MSKKTRPSVVPDRSSWLTTEIRSRMENQAMRKLLFAVVAGVAAWIAPGVQAQAPVTTAPAATVAQPPKGEPIPPPIGVVPAPVLHDAASCEPYCQVKTKKVCVPEHTTKIYTKVIYCSDTRDFCFPKCSFCCHFGHGCDKGCDDGHGGHGGIHGLHDFHCPEPAGCGHACHRHVLLKKACEIECPDVKCHVEEQVVTPCAHGKCAAGGCPAPCATGPQVIPVVPSGSVPYMPPANGAPTPNGSQAVSQPSPSAQPIAPVTTVPVVPSPAPATNAGNR